MIKNDNIFMLINDKTIKYDIGFQKYRLENESLWLRLNSSIKYSFSYISHK